MIFFLSQTWIVQELEPTTEMDHFHNSTTGDGDDDDGYAFVMERKFFGEIVKGLKMPWFTKSYNSNSFWTKGNSKRFLVVLKPRPNADIVLSESVDQSNPGIDLSVEKYLRFVEKRLMGSTLICWGLLDSQMRIKIEIK